MITALKKFFGKTQKETSVASAKHNEKTEDRQQVPDKTNFLRDFTENLQKKEDFTTEKPISQTDIPNFTAMIESEIRDAIDISGPMEMTAENKELLKRSITISLDFPVERKDLHFVANSRIDGKPIYMYTGNNFSNFDLPYEEVISIETYVPPTDQKLVTKYIDYLADQIEKNISYTEYVAESLNQALNRNQRSYTEDDLLRRKEEMKLKWMQKYGDLHNIDK